MFLNFCNEHQDGVRSDVDGGYLHKNVLQFNVRCPAVLEFNCS
jgi:hypothetical protein